MSNEIVKSAAELGMPLISGQVSVSLAELDRMRADHAKAVKLAQDLESKQRLVKVVVNERRRVATVVTDRDFRGLPSSRAEIGEEYVTISTDYKNLDDVREAIRKEEYARLEQVIDEARNAESIAKVELERQRTDVAKLQKLLLQTDDMRATASRDSSKLKLENKALETRLEHTLDELERVRSLFTDVTSVNEKLTAELHTVRKAKGFLYWVTH